MSAKKHKAKIGIALGSGSARGWAHIGIIKALEANGIKPEIICGTSIGALVGSMYATNELEFLEKWLLKLDKRKIVKYTDISLLAAGGFVEGNSLMNFFKKQIGDHNIEDLDKQFACVATDLESGTEKWIQHGSILDAVRASIAVPGLFTPVKYHNHWLVDGALVNPVPISVCRALGAEKVIAVNLHVEALGKPLKRPLPNQDSLFSSLIERTMLTKFTNQVKGSFPDLFKEKQIAPGIFDVLTNSINIMQDRITRSRMAGDPADVLLLPKLGHIGLMEFDRAEEAIQAGEEVVTLHMPYIKSMLNLD